MSINYTQLGTNIDSTFKTLGVKLTLTQQPEGSTSSVFGVMVDLPDANNPDTNVLFKQSKILLSPKLKVVPKPGDWITRGSSDDRFVVQSIEAVAPAGKVVLYKLVVAL